MYISRALSLRFLRFSLFCSQQGKYILLDSGNELANRLRGVLSGFFLGVLTDRVFVADITYQKDVTDGLLSALFEGPGYEVCETLLVQ